MYVTTSLSAGSLTESLPSHQRLDCVCLEDNTEVAQASTSSSKTCTSTLKIDTVPVTLTIRPCNEILASFQKLPGSEMKTVFAYSKTEFANKQYSSRDDGKNMYTMATTGSLPRKLSITYLNGYRKRDHFIEISIELLAVSYGFLLRDI